MIGGKTVARIKDGKVQWWNEYAKEWKNMSARACDRILWRADERNAHLPAHLRDALHINAAAGGYFR